MLKSPRKILIFLPTRYCKQSMNSDNGDFGDLYINAVEIRVLINCFFRVNIEMALKSSFDKIVISLEYPYSMLLNLFKFELECIVFPKLIRSCRCLHLFQVVFQSNIICHYLINVFH